MRARALPRLMVFFPLAYVLVLAVGPSAYAFLLSFQGSGPTLENYYEVLTTRSLPYMLVADPLAPRPPWGALVNTAIWLAVQVPAVALGGLLLAYLLKFHVRGSDVAKTLIFLGMVVPPAIGGLIIFLTFESGVGLVPMVFSALGVEPLARSWMSSPDLALWALILGSIWLWMGFGVTVYAAAMEAIPRSHIEAARLFGASTWQIFSRIVIPEVKPAVVVVVVMTAIWVFKKFDMVYAATGGGPGGATNVMPLVAYHYLVGGLYPQAAAVASILALLALPFMVLAARRWI